MRRPLHALDRMRYAPRPVSQLQPLSLLDRSSPMRLKTTRLYSKSINSFVTGLAFSSRWLATRLKRWRLFLCVLEHSAPNHSLACSLAKTRDYTTFAYHDSGPFTTTKQFPYCHKRPQFSKIRLIHYPWISGPFKADSSIMKSVYASDRSSGFRHKAFAKAS